MAHVNAKERRRLARLEKQPPPPPKPTNPATGEELSKTERRRLAKAVKKNKDVLQKYFGGKDMKAIGKAFKRLDTDGSGDLTWDEFVAGSQRVIAEL